jgi:hypothetical protein
VGQQKRYGRRRKKAPTWGARDRWLHFQTVHQRFE